MKRRLTLLTEIIAPYRIPVFNALAARDDIDLHVIFLAETDPGLRQWLVYKNEIRFSYQVLPSFRRRIGKYNLLLNRGLAKALEHARPEVILCGGYNYVASWQALGWARKRSIPFLLWIESTAADQRRHTFAVEALKRRFLAACRAFVVPGKASQAYLRQLAVPEESVFVAPNAVDNAFFAERARNARRDRDGLRAKLGLPERYFLFVGRLVEAKGILELLDAYAKLDGALRSVVGLVMVGDGSARAALEKYAAAIRPGAIRVAGFVQREDLPAFYALADALIFPTHSDTWGFVVNEAMACECPVIASEVAGCVPDLVEDGWNGKVVPARDAARLAATMEYLAAQDHLKAEMGIRGGQRIAGVFSASLRRGHCEGGDGMRVETWSDVPRNARIAIWGVVCAVALFWVKGHLGYFRNVTYLSGLIVAQVILASLWHFETIFFPLLMAFFCWAGMDVPWTGVAFTGRWFILAVAAVAGFVIWMRQPKHTYTAFHLTALFCVVAALVSAMVSNDPATAVLKVVSLFLLFAYGAGGARLAMRGHEVSFTLGLLTAIEIVTYLTGLAYLADAHIWGNPNSLGAIMGVAVTPFLLWGLLIADTRMQRYRRFAALCIAGVLLYTSLSRAGMLAAMVSSLTMLVALRRQRLLLQGGFVVMTFLAIAAVAQPEHFDDLVGTFTSNVVRKGRDEGIFNSRKTPWQETVAVIKEHPWFGSGFGTSDMGRFGQGTSLSLAPSTGGLYTREGANREHGNSYLALAEYVGLLGLLPFSVFLFLLVRMIVQVVRWMRRTANPHHCAVPIAMMLVSGLIHAFFEDWLLAVGYYLCVFFWVSAFWLADLQPAPLPAVELGTSGAHPRSRLAYPGVLVPTR